MSRRFERKEDRRWEDFASRVSETRSASLRGWPGSPRIARRPASRCDADRSDGEGDEESHLRLTSERYLTAVVLEQVQVVRRRSASPVPASPACVGGAFRPGVAFVAGLAAAAASGTDSPALPAAVPPPSPPAWASAPEDRKIERPARRASHAFHEEILPEWRQPMPELRGQLQAERARVAERRRVGPAVHDLGQHLVVGVGEVLDVTPWG